MSRHNSESSRPTSCPTKEGRQPQASNRFRCRRHHPQEPQTVLAIIARPPSTTRHRRPKISPVRARCSYRRGRVAAWQSPQSSQKTLNCHRSSSSRTVAVAKSSSRPNRCLWYRARPITRHPITPTTTTIPTPRLQIIMLLLPAVQY